MMGSKIRERLLLASVAVLAGCGDDGGTKPPTGAAPTFVILAPLPDDVVAGTVEVRVAALRPELSRVAVRTGGTALGDDAAASSERTILFPASALPEGRVDIEIEGFDASGASLAAEVVSVVSVPDPPDRADIGSTGGALATASGVVVVVPPGALDQTRSFLVRDRPTDQLPAGVLARELSPIAAIDFLNGDGQIDPNFELAEPASIEFPKTGVSGAGLKRSTLEAESDLGIFAVQDGGSGASRLQFVSSVVDRGGSYRSQSDSPPVIVAVENLTSPGESLRPLDLIRVSGQNIPRGPDDMLVLVDGAPGFSAIVDPAGDSAIFVVPSSAILGANRQVKLFNRWARGFATVTTDIEARTEAVPDAAESDRRINLFFDRLSSDLELLETWSFDSSAGSGFARWTRIRDDFQSRFDSPLGQWRGLVEEERQIVLSESEATRIEVGVQLETLERNLAVLDGASRGQLNELGKAACAGMYAMAFVGQVWGLVNTVPFSVGDLVGGKLVEASVGRMFNLMYRVGCFDGMFRNRGIVFHECDMIARMNELDLTSTFDGTTLGVGQRMGSDGEEVTTVEPEAGVGVDPILLPMSGSPRDPIVDPISDRIGRFLLTFLPADENIELAAHGRTTSSTVTMITTPGDFEGHFIPLFLPRELGPVGPDLGVSDLFDFRAGIDQGIAPPSTSAVRTGDFDDDGDVDIYFAGQLDFGPSRSLLGTIALNAGQATFTSSRAWSPDLTGGTSVDFGPPEDLDGDGHLDFLVAGNALQSNEDIGAFFGDGTGALRAGVLVPTQASACAQPSAMVTGDFVPGNGLDVLVASTYLAVGGDPNNIAAPITGTLCLFENQGDGSYVARESTFDTRSTVNRSVGRSVDIDRDGNLDAWMPGLGLVVFGDGAGGFSEFLVPDACADRTSLGSPRITPTSAAPMLDHDRDGLVDLLMSERNTPEGTGFCVLRNQGDRTFELVTIPPVMGRCEGSSQNANTCSQVEAADLDADGNMDLLWSTRDGLGLSLGSRTGFTERPYVTLAIDALNHFGIADFDNDGGLDVAMAVVGLSRAHFGLNKIAASRSVIRVRLRGRTGAPASPGALIEIDLDGNGDFSPSGEYSLHVAGGAPELVGLGTRSSADIRVTFIDVGTAGGEVVVRNDVAAGTVVDITDAQP